MKRNKSDILTEEILSNDGLKVLQLSLLNSFYNELGIERFPEYNLHKRNFNTLICQYTPLVQDPIISFSSKSLVIALNKDQICKIRLDGNAEIEYENHLRARSKTKLFPRLEGVVNFKDGFKGIIMERLKVFEKINFTSGELNRLYFQFLDDISELHQNGILHNDLGYAKKLEIRPNIVLTENTIRLIDCETLIFKDKELNWQDFQIKEQLNIDKLFNELIEFKCQTLT